MALGRINFPDEVIFGNALCKVYNTPKPAPEIIQQPKVDNAAIRAIIEQADDGYLHPEKVQALFDAAGIPRAGEAVVSDKEVGYKGSIGFRLTCCNESGRSGA